MDITSTSGISYTICNHYQKRCIFKCKECGDKRMYGCLRCHNESEDNLNHTLTKESVLAVVCTACHSSQLPGPLKCNECGEKFASFYCDKCFVFEDTKDIWHCKECGTCKRGNPRNYKHCRACQQCVRDKGHACKAAEDTTCLFCNEPIESCGNVLSFPCQHKIHIECWNPNMETCARCKTSLYNRLAKSYSDENIGQPGQTPPTQNIFKSIASVFTNADPKSSSSAPSFFS